MVIFETKILMRTNQNLTVKVDIMESWYIIIHVISAHFFCFNIF